MILSEDELRMWLRREAHAEEALDRLLEEGAVEEDLVKMLKNAALFAALRDGHLPGEANDEDLWGMSKDSIDRLPERVRLFAADIEKVNRSVLGKPFWIEYWQGAKAEIEGNEQAKPRIAALAGFVSELPVLLRYYADFLDFQRLKGKSHRTKTLRFAAVALEVGLLLYVRRETGELHFPEVSLLLEDSYSAFSGGQDAGSYYQSDNLSQRFYSFQEKPQSFSEAEDPPNS